VSDCSENERPQNNKKTKNVKVKTKLLTKHKHKQTGAWLALFENIFVLESRLVLTDGYLLLFFALSLAATFALARQIVFSWQWLIATIWTGLALGCTLSVKFTGLGAVGLVGVHQLYALLRWHIFGPRRKSSSVIKALYNLIVDAGVRGIVILGLAVAVLTLMFAIHITILPYNGEGNGFMSQEWRNSLVARPSPGKPEPEIDPYLKQLSMPARIWELVHIMWVVNLGLRAPHPFGSTWDGWPLMTARVVHYWGGLQNPQHISSIGNPFVWWFSFASMVIFLIWLGFVGIYKMVQCCKPRDPSEELKKQLGIVTHRGKSSWIGRITESFVAVIVKRAPIGVILVIGYIGNLVPYMGIKRVCFNYHYMPALLVAIHSFALLIDILLKVLGRLRNKSVLRLGYLFVVLLAMAIGWCFLYFSPWTYGTSITVEEHAARVWVQSWYNK